jgi:hypothetical protein
VTDFESLGSGERSLHTERLEGRKHRACNRLVDLDRPILYAEVGPDVSCWPLFVGRTTQIRQDFKVKPMSRRDPLGLGLRMLISGSDATYTGGQPPNPFCP